MKAFNVYITGVGGQGIGLLSEIILRAADHAGQRVKSVDTHGLAQRGGIVVSQIRMGDAVHSPLIPAGSADLAVSLERHEALRAVESVVKKNGSLIYYDTVWQPLSVRLGEAEEVSSEDLQQRCNDRGIQVVAVFDAELPDIRMQNMAVLGGVVRYQMIPGVEERHYRSAMEDLMEGKMLDRNQALFNRLVQRETL